MRTKVWAAGSLIAGGIMAMTAGVHGVEAGPKVKMTTTLGVIEIELDSAAAPKTVANFVQYVKDGFYDGTVFHRVIRGFMVQGGGFTTNMDRKETRAPVANEAGNKLKNTRGTIAMARTSDPHSASSQFFINTVDNVSLDFKGENARDWGYCVFGKVISGMDVVDKIEAVKTTTKSPFADVPVEAVVIEKAVIPVGK